MNKQTTSIKEFFAAKKTLPSWLVNHKVFKSVDTVEKVFPRIGLSNCSERVQINQMESARSAGLELVNAIHNHVDDVGDRLVAATRAKPPTSEIADAVCGKLAALHNVLHEQYPLSFVVQKGSKITLTLPRDLVWLGKPVYKKGEGLFRVYGKLREELLTLRRNDRNVPKLLSLDKMALFKAFSSVNIPSNRFSIVFSSDGIDGLWDIATMSMRGIKSCQRWQGQYKRCLIGSIIDPFTAIIYLTSGTDYKQFGSKMVRRCVVRFLVDGKDDKPIIAIDKMYPAPDKEVLGAFTAFIKQKTGGKFGIEYAPDLVNDERYAKTYIPKTPVEDIIAKHSTKGSIHSYQDTKFNIGKQNATLEKRHLYNLCTRERNIEAAIRMAVSELRFNDLIVKECGINKGLATKIHITGPDFRYQITSYAERIAALTTAIHNDAAPNQSETFDERTRRICHCFFANKKTIVRIENAALVRRLNAYFKLKETRVKSADIKGIIAIVVDTISKTYKRQALATFHKSVQPQVFFGAAVSSKPSPYYIDAGIFLAS